MLGEVLKITLRNRTQNTKTVKQVIKSVIKKTSNHSLLGTKRDSLLL